MPAGGGTAEQITRSGAEGPSLSPDGQWLYFTKKEGVDGLWRVPVAGGEETRVVDSLFRYNYFATSSGVYYATRPDAAGLHSTVRYFDFATKKTTDIMPVDARLDLGLAVSPDGKYLLFTKIDYLGADLMLVEKFR
jgi:Tol biopolymer transport system component